MVQRSLFLKISYGLTKSLLIMDILIFAIIPFVLLFAYLVFKQKKADDNESGSSGKKSFVGNPFLGKLIEADDSDLIADELFRVSVAYQNGGYMLPKDDKKALEYCRKAAEKGHAVAQLFMAQWLMRYHDDHNPEVMSWLMKAAGQGEPQAMYNLGVSYHRGDIESKIDIEKSLELFRKSAENLYGPACARLAIIFLNGEDGIVANKDIAKFWAWEAYINGDKEDGSLFSHLVEEEDIIDGKLNWERVYGRAAQAGERFAYHVMGIAYVEEHQEDKARKCWGKASQLGCIQSMYNLGVLLQNTGKKEGLFNLYQTAAEQGHVMALFTLASCYFYGTDIEKDIKKAWYWNEKAVNFGYTPARYLLAVMCLQGTLIEILPDKVQRGLSYLEQAAQDNYQPAIDFYKKHNIPNLPFHAGPLIQ